MNGVVEGDMCGEGEGQKCATESGESVPQALKVRERASVSGPLSSGC